MKMKMKRKLERLTQRTRVRRIEIQRSISEPKLEAGTRFLGARLEFQPS